ncbi:alpha/beta fold hydrolase [Nonomuraea endophytica]|uniref:alpha/beta fold hydrolase n=1 Tax=Nonomuraea endophytica TaxID=714136 RepID=UPI0037C6FA34
MRFLIALLGALALLITPQSASATGTKPTVVLVHGAFADASGWNGVIARLQAAGYPVIAPANPLRDLTGDAAYVSSVIKTIPGPVVLVGHSYGGAVITNAAAGNPNVKALVYVAAFALDSGESAQDVLGRFPGSKLPGALIVRPYPGGADAYIAPARFREVFAADVPSSTTRLLSAGQRPVAAGALQTPSGAPTWSVLRSWYLIPGGDQAIPPAAQRFMAGRAGSKVIELPGASHAVMVSRPSTTAAVILAAAHS